MADVRDLQQLVNDRLHELGDRKGPLSARQAAARANGKVSYETLRLIARGDHSGKLTDETVDGLALALDVPRSRVLAAMGLALTQPLPPFMLPDRANRLTRPQRKVVLSVVDAILGAVAEAAEDPPAPLRAVASGQRGPAGAGQREAKEKAAKARREQGER